MKKSLILAIFIFLISACNKFPVINAEPSSSVVKIHDIQGCSRTSPYSGKKVTAIQGIVTWKDDQGFFIQETDPDTKECSSEAIYVFTRQYSEVIPGDLVEVSGSVDEFIPDPSVNDELTSTEIKASSVKIISSENDLPQPTLIGSSGRVPPDKLVDDNNLTTFDPEKDGIDFYESLEGMRVEIENARVVNPENAYKEIYVIPSDMAGKNVLSAQGALLSDEKDVNPERILVVLPNTFKKTLNLGDRFDQPIIGILTYKYGNYEIIETNSPSIQSAKKTNFAEMQTVKSDSVLRVAAYNVENLNRFDQNRVSKLASQIVKYLGSPDILVLEEIQDDSGNENDGTTNAAKTLNAITQQIKENGGPAYTSIDNPPQNNSSGGEAGGNIRTVILFRDDRGLKLAAQNIQDKQSSLSPFKNSRFPIICQFVFHGQPLYVIGVHLVSNSANSPLFGSIQPIQKPDDEKRMNQTKWIAAIASELEAQNPAATILIAGDFNDTPDSKSLQILQNAGFIDLGNQVNASERYSILFQGNAYLYDQILINSSSSFSVSAASVVHINTYLNEKQQNSDHDPFVIDLSIK